MINKNDDDVCKKMHRKQLAGNCVRKNNAWKEKKHKQQMMGKLFDTAVLAGQEQANRGRSLLGLAPRLPGPDGRHAAPGRQLGL